MALALKTWLCETARRLRNPVGFLCQGGHPQAEMSNQEEAEMIDLEEISRLAAEIEKIDSNTPDSPEKARKIAQLVEKGNQLALAIASTENNETSATKGMFKAKALGDFNINQRQITETFTLSKSLMPKKCSTAPEICLWAGSLSFRRNYEDLTSAVRHSKGEDGDAVRKLAIMHVAYRQRWYRVDDDAGFDYPPGTSRTSSLQSLQLASRASSVTYHHHRFDTS